VCILMDSVAPSGLATFQVLSSHIWLAATGSDSMGQECGERRGGAVRSLRDEQRSPWISFQELRGALVGLQAGPV
jgi:hypothetical protein